MYKKIQAKLSNKIFPTLLVKSLHSPLFKNYMMYCIMGQQH